MLKASLLPLLLFSLITHLGGCQTTASPLELKTSVKGFNENLRWERFDAAATFLPPAERSAFVRHYLELQEDLSIQNLEVRNVQLHEQEEIPRAQVLILAEYYLLPSTVVHRQTLTQEWEFQQGVWLLVNPGFHPQLPQKKQNPATQDAADPG